MTIVAFPDFAENPAHILLKILQLGSERASFFLSLISHLHHGKKLSDFIDELAGVVSHEHSHTAFDVLEVDGANEDFFGSMPDIEVLRPALGNNHEHDQGQAKVIVFDGSIDWFYHFAAQTVEEFFA